MELRLKELKKGWKWYIDDIKKKKCVANSGNNYWASKKGAKRGFDRFVDQFMKRL